MLLNTNDFISMPELAELLGVTRQAIYNWLKAGTAPRYERFNGRYLFYKDDANRKKEAMGK